MTIMAKLNKNIKSYYLIITKTILFYESSYWTGKGKKLSQIVLWLNL